MQWELSNKDVQTYLSPLRVGRTHVFPSYELTFWQNIFFVSYESAKQRLSPSPAGVPVSTTVGNKTHDDNVVDDDDDDDDDDDNVSETYADVLIDTNGHNDCLNDDDNNGEDENDDDAIGFFFMSTAFTIFCRSTLWTYITKPIKKQ